MTRGFLAGDPIELLGCIDRYKIIDTCVAVKSRCVTGIGNIA